MKRKLFSIIFASLLVTSLVLIYSVSYSLQKVEQSEFFFGLDVAYEDIEKIKVLANEVRSYTNLFIIGCTGITHNTTKLDELCQYLYDGGL